jgi:hypothetical protein
LENAGINKEKFEAEKAREKGVAVDPGRTI